MVFIHFEKGSDCSGGFKKPVILLNQSYNRPVARLFLEYVPKLLKNSSSNDILPSTSKAKQKVPVFGAKQFHRSGGLKALAKAPRELVLPPELV